MTEVLNPRRQQQPSSSSSDSPSRERPRPPALKTSHSALRSINRPPNVRRISNRVSIAEPPPKSDFETQLKAETIKSSVPKTPDPATDNATNVKPPPDNLATTANPIAHTTSTLKIAQTLHSSLSSRLQLHVTTTPWATRNILTLDGGGIKGYSSLILLRTLMQEIAALEQSLSPPAFCSADPTGNENYYFTKSDEAEDHHFYSGVGTEMGMLDCERAGKLRGGKRKVKIGDLKVDVPPGTMRRGEYLPSHYFDYIAGTSVGGLIAIMLGVMGRTVEGCLEEFRNGGEGRSSRRDGRGLPVLFLEMEEDAAAEEEEKVDVGDGGSQSQKREQSSSRAEGRRRRRVISFPGLSGTLEIPLPGFHGGADTSREKDKRRTTWPTKKSRAWFDTFAKFSVTSTDLTGAGTGSGNNTAASRAIVSDSEDTSPTTKRANTNNTVASSCSSTTNSSPTSSISFKKTSFQCQTLAWCSEIDSATPTERHPYAFCTYEEVLAADGSDEEGKVPSIPEVAKAITTPSDSSQFKPFKLPAIGQFVDGSKEIRDPTLPVLKEISSLLGVDPSTLPSVPDTSNPPIDLLLSLGTDEHNAWFYEKLVQPFSSPSTSSSPPSPTSSPISSPSASTTSPSPLAPALEELRQSKGHLYTHYHRFQVSPLSLSPFPFFSLPFRRHGTNNHHLDEIEQATERWLSANNGEQRRLLKKYAELLVRKRRARSATTRWETFALGVRYFCWVEGCERNPETCKKGHGKGKGKGYGDVGGGGRGKDGDQGNGNKERDEGEEIEEEGEGEGKGEGDKGFDTRGDFWDHLNSRHGLLSKKGAREVEDELDKGRRFGFA